MSKKSEKALEQLLERNSLLRYWVINQTNGVLSRHEEFPDAASSALKAADEHNEITFVSEITYAVIPERGARVINAKV